MNNWTTILFWGVAVAVLFGYLWWKGHIARLTLYFQETWQELKPGRCSWPTWAELRGSTVLIGITIALLGVFLFLVDMVCNRIFTKVL